MDNSEFPQAFADLVSIEFGQAIDVEPPRFNTVIMGSGGRILAQFCENEDGQLDVIGEPEDFTDAAELFAQALMQMWIMTRQAGGNHGPAT
jgi:hypothetical protein